MMNWWWLLLLNLVNVTAPNAVLNSLLFIIMFKFFIYYCHPKRGLGNYSAAGFYEQQESSGLAQHLCYLDPVLFEY